MLLGIFDLGKFSWFGFFGLGIFRTGDWVFLAFGQQYLIVDCSGRFLAGLRLCQVFPYTFFISNDTTNYEAKRPDITIIRNMGGSYTQSSPNQLANNTICSLLSSCIRETRFSTWSDQRSIVFPANIFVIRPLSNSDDMSSRGSIGFNDQGLVVYYGLSC